MVWLAELAAADWAHGIVVEAAATV